jgi:hypothetical protein
VKVTSPRELVARLRSLRGTFGRDAEATKFDAVRQLADATLRRADDVSRFHDELLFLTAFPDSARIRALADSTLAAFAERVQHLTAPQRHKLADGGIAGTVTAHTFMYGVAHWLVKHGEQVTLDWKAMEDAERLDPLLRLTLSPAEEDAFDSGEFSTAEWVELASGKPRAQVLPWLLSGAPERATTLAHRSWRGLYNDANVPILWELGASARSASRNRADVSRPKVRRAFRALPADVASRILTPLAGITRLRGQAAADWHDACVAAIVARAREVLPTICANLDEIYVAPLGEGVQLCVLGVAPEERMALESNYGYVIFSNGVPVGYGGVTTMSAQANTGANVFESFRHSEAPFLFAETLRAFRTLFGVTRFVVNPYQIGADNDEALATGAYWFYHRLGFRPVRAGVAALANKEYARIRKNRAHRSSIATLRRLASCDLVLELADSAGTVLFDEQWLVTMGRAVVEHLASHPAGARQAHVEALSRTLCERLTGARRPLRADERAGAAYLVPVIALLQDEVSAWPSDDRAALWELVRLKGQRREREFALASRAHVRWWQALARFCAST